MTTRDEARRRLERYRSAAARGNATAALRKQAREAYQRLGGDPQPGSLPLGGYDHERFGPFLGVSDEGSAAGAIRDAAMASPKALALTGPANRDPLVLGVAVDAERLGGIGEIAVGPDEYADIWLECVGRLLITTNVGTRVNVRVYRREPRVVLRGDSTAALNQAKEAIAGAFRPFVETPAGRPRPLTVFVEIPRSLRPRRRRSVLKRLQTFVASGNAAGTRTAPRGQRLGLVTWIRGRPADAADSLEAIDLASAVGIDVVMFDGVRRKAADAAISLAGLLDYFPPGVVGPLLRRARQRKVQIRTANLPDTDTIARGVWAGLNSARAMGVNLGKYGCFPLTLAETDRVVQLIQRWFEDWSAAPVFFVDQGLLRDGAVDVERDLPRGIEAWLTTVARRGVRVVLIDTVDKATGRRLVKRSAEDKTGYLGPRQIDRIEAHARKLGVRVLWAGGLGFRDVFEMGKRGVFGIYVTSTAATTVPVAGGYVRDPALAGVKEPSKEGVLRTKILLEAGFLARALGDTALGASIQAAADEVLALLDQANAARTRTKTAKLAALCVRGWRTHWKT